MTSFSTALACAKAVAATVAAAQPLNPAYLNEMPDPPRILSAIKGKNPEDTIERQMGAFQALMKIVDDMAWTQERRYLPTRATPDENAVKLRYGNAYADLWHKATNGEFVTPYRDLGNTRLRCADIDT